MTLDRKRFSLIISVLLVILIIPLVAGQFTAEVNWKFSDFLVAGLLLGGAGFFIQLILRKIKDKKFCILLIMSLIAALILTWIELAVGIFGTPLGGN